MQRLLSFIPEFSTRYTIEIGLNSEEYANKYTENISDVYVAASRGSYDAYIVDVSDQGLNPTAVMREITSRRPVRPPCVVFLLADAPPMNDLRRESYGSVCFLECFFNAPRLNDALRRCLGDVVASP